VVLFWSYQTHQYFAETVRTWWVFFSEGCFVWSFLKHNGATCIVSGADSVAGGSGAELGGVPGFDVLAAGEHEERRGRAPGASRPPPSPGVA